MSGEADHLAHVLSVSTISVRDRTIDEQQKATQELTNTIDMKNGIIQERDAALLSLQADNTLEAERLRGNRLGNIDSACLAQLRVAAEVQRARTEMAEREREGACMECLTEPRAVVLPCG